MNMKKVICFVVFCIAALAVTSCGEEKRQKAEREFHETMNNNDYETAYIKLGEVRTYCGIMTYEKCRNEVVRKEATFLLSQEDEQSAKRILYLLTQYFDSYEKYNRLRLKEELFEIAERLKNEEAMKVLELSKEEKEYI